MLNVAAQLVNSIFSGWRVSPNSVPTTTTAIAHASVTDGPGLSNLPAELINRVFDYLTDPKDILSFMFLNQGNVEIGMTKLKPFEEVKKSGIASPNAKFALAVANRVLRLYPNPPETIQARDRSMVWRAGALEVKKILDGDIIRKFTLKYFKLADPAEDVRTWDAMISSSTNKLIDAIFVSMVATLHLSGELIRPPRGKLTDELISKILRQMHGLDNAAMIVNENILPEGVRIRENVRNMVDDLALHIFGVNGTKKLDKWPWPIEAINFYLAHGTNPLGKSPEPNCFLCDMLVKPSLQKPLDTFFEEYADFKRRQGERPVGKCFLEVFDEIRRSWTPRPDIRHAG